MQPISILQREGILLASGNRHKAEEFARLLAPLAIHVSIPADYGFAFDPEESADNFAGNALIKARALLQIAIDAGVHARPVLADDSGLEVDALGGEPGVRSARYGGPTLDDAGRRRFLLEKLSGVAVELRQARFVAVLALLLPVVDSDTKGSEIKIEEYLFRGECEGWIAESEAGEGGFGYDPLFLIEDRSATFAELSPERKDRLSHRGRAFAAFAAMLAPIGG